MYIKIIFKGSDTFDCGRLIKKTNGFVNNLLGDDNSFHGSFSSYSVSRMQGGRYDGDKVSFANGGFIVISSNDEDFLSIITDSLIDKRKRLAIGNLIYEDFTVYNEDVGRYFDLIRTTSPIRLTSKDKGYVTYKDDEFLPLLREKSIRKLVHFGMDESVANTLSFELFHKEKAHTVSLDIDGAKSGSSLVMLIVRGKEEARRALYEMGLGSSTGFCFGSVTIIKH